MLNKGEQVILLVLAFLVLSGSGFRLWMRQGDVIIEVAETAPEKSGTAEIQSPVDANLQRERAEMADFGQNSKPVAPATGSQSERAALVNLNTATSEVLDSLPGIGPALAQRIIENRISYGRYRSVEELSRVRGIGSETVERLRPFVVVE